MANQQQTHKTAVQYLRVSDEYEGQRIDNFLVARLKKVPKTHIYRILRKGEVRVNKKRVDPSYRLAGGDEIRLPPLHLGVTAKQVPPSKETMNLLASRILYEDKYILVINKPSGMAVHAGSQVRLGVVEILRYMYPHSPHLELAHRLDSDTSGCLILGKKRSILKEVHGLFREGKVDKIYWALTKGQWKTSELKVNAPLHRYLQQGGERLVKVQAEGKEALTIFRPLEVFSLDRYSDRADGCLRDVATRTQGSAEGRMPVPKNNHQPSQNDRGQVFSEASLMEATLYTGRTHQIRVHAQYQRHPIAGDDRYGDKEFNHKMRELGLSRLFLHAKSIDLVIPSIDLHIHVEAPLDLELEQCLHDLRAHNK